MAREQKKEAKPAAMLAAIRIRGIMRIHSSIGKTMEQLRLYRKNFCFVFPNNTTYTGMLMKAKDYITWGEIDDDTFNLLVNKRGEESKGRETDSKKKIKYDDFIIVNNKKIKKYFRLNPPKRGFEKKGIKNSFQKGGALGYRGEKINDLIKRMV